MRLTMLAMVAAIASSGAVVAQTNADRWNLADLYPSVAAWNEDAAKLERQIGDFERCKGAT